MVQNKFHYAIVGQTAEEIIYTKSDREKEHMGLTTWKNAPDGHILKSDAGIAKNYLEEKQIRQSERAVTGYFDYTEDLIERENTFTMEEFAASVNEFLAFRDGVLQTTGTEIDKLMPPVSRFGGGGRAKKKQGVMEKLKAFFEKYFGLGIAEFRSEEQMQSSIYEINPTYLMVAEEPAPYGKRKN